MNPSQLLAQFGACPNGRSVDECKFSFFEGDEWHVLIGAGTFKIAALEHISRNKFPGTQAILKVDSVSGKAFSYKPKKLEAHF